MFTTRRLLFAPVLQWSPHHPQGPHWGGGGPHWGGGGMGGGMGAAAAPGAGGGLLSLLWVVVLLALVALVGYALLRSRGGATTAGEDDPVDALRVRYARGDVDDEEFARRYERLTDDSASH